jgi:colicin import membrane protein
MNAAMNALPGMSTTRGDKTKARALALAMHAAFIVLLIFGVSWQRTPEAPVMADLWSSLPPMAQPPQPKVDVAPPPEPDPPPKPVPRVEPRPVPKAAPVLVPKPDIAIKAKEKEKKAEPKKVDDKAAREKAIEAKRAADERDAKLKKFLEADKAAEAKAAAEKAERAAAEQAAKAAAARENQKYINGIYAKVWPRVRVPTDIQGNPEAVFMVSLLPGGDLQSIDKVQSSGNAAYDAAIELAIRQAQPFDVPSGDEFHKSFRRISMAFRPKR